MTNKGAQKENLMKKNNQCRNKTRSLKTKKIEIIKKEPTSPRSEEHTKWNKNSIENFSRQLKKTEESKFKDKSFAII